MSFNYQNPLTGNINQFAYSVNPTDTNGNTFSVLNIGGYMEVWLLSDLNFSTHGATGNINYSGNTIPISLYIRPTGALTDRLTLNNDGISSGRRRIGMLVYVNETQTVYQFQIDNYETLFNNALTDGCITSTSTSYTVSDRVGGVEKASGHALFSAWSGSTIEGVSGITRSNANWRIFQTGNSNTSGTSGTSGSSGLNGSSGTDGSSNIRNKWY